MLRRPTPAACPSCCSLWGSYWGTGTSAGAAGAAWGCSAALPMLRCPSSWLLSWASSATTGGAGRGSVFVWSLAGGWRCASQQTNWHMCLHFPYTCFINAAVPKNCYGPAFSSLPIASFPTLLAGCRPPASGAAPPSPLPFPTASVAPAASPPSQSTPSSTWGGAPSTAPAHGSPPSSPCWTCG